MKCTSFSVDEGKKQLFKNPRSNDCVNVDIQTQQKFFIRIDLNNLIYVSLKHFGVFFFSTLLHD